MKEPKTAIEFKKLKEQLIGKVAVNSYGNKSKITSIEIDETDFGPRVYVALENNEAIYLNELELA